MKKLSPIFRLLVLLNIAASWCQTAPNLSFAVSEYNLGYGGNVNLFASTNDSDGNLFVAGSFFARVDVDLSVNEFVLNATNPNINELFIAKYSPLGDLIWARQLGGTGSVDVLSMTVGGGRLFIAGNFTQTVDFDPSISTANLTVNNGNKETYLLVLDTNGLYEAAKSFIGSYTINCYALRYTNQLVVAGNISGSADFDLSTGTQNLTSSGGTDLFMAAYNAQLNLVWAFNMGGTNDDQIFDITSDSANNLYCIGEFSGTVDFDPTIGENNLTATDTSRATFLAKFSPTGGLLWAKNLNMGTAANEAVKPNRLQIEIDPTNIVKVAISFKFTTFTSSYNRVYYASINSSGIVTRSKFFNYAAVTSMTILPMNNICVIMGTCSSTTDFGNNTPITLNTNYGTNFYAGLDINGQASFARNFKAPITQIQPTSNDYFFLLGNFNQTYDFDPILNNIANLSSNKTNVFIANYSTDGNYQFVKKIDDLPNNTSFHLIANDASGAIYRAGNLSAATDLDPSSQTAMVSSLTNPGVFIAKYGSNGQYIWSKTITGTGYVQVWAMNTDPQGNTYLCGFFDGSVDFDPSPNTSLLTALDTNNSSIKNMFMAKFDAQGQFLWAKQLFGMYELDSGIEFDAAGNYYISGYQGQSVTIDFDPSPAEFLVPNGGGFLAKYSPQGEFVWVKPLSEANILKLRVKNGKVFAVGEFLGQFSIGPSPSQTIYGYDEFNGFYLEFNEDGTLLQNKVIGYDNQNINHDPFVIESTRVRNIEVDDDGNLFFLFSFLNHIELNLNGGASTIITSPLFPQYVNSTSIDATYVICKYDSSFQLKWGKPLIRLNDPDYANEFDVYGLKIIGSDICLAVNIAGIIDFDPSSGESLASSVSAPGGYFYSLPVIANYNRESGDLIRADKIDSSLDSRVYNISLTPNQNMLCAGSFSGNIQLDLQGNTQTLSSQNAYYDRFWVGYGMSTLSVAELAMTSGFKVYPNPTNNRITVSHKNLEMFEVRVCDLTGKNLLTKTLSNLQSVDLTEFPSGMYLITLTKDENKETFKVIKQ